jgi:phosphoribosylanthranilate isomerase
LEKEAKNTIDLNSPTVGRGAGLFIKVCGMRDSANIQELANLKPDFIGFIFYEKSKRFVAYNLDINVLNNLHKSVKKVGVFVDEPEESILKIVEKYNLDYVQLHGDESAQFCKNLKEKGIKIIKAFSVDETFDFETTIEYQNVCTLFLFDTKTAEKGGSGKTFNWQILEKYQGSTPFLLAGGIDENNFEKAKNIKNKYFFGLDLNSKFEIEPGFKDIEKLKIILK